MRKRNGLSADVVLCKYERKLIWWDMFFELSACFASSEDISRSRFSQVFYDIFASKISRNFEKVVVGPGSISVKFKPIVFLEKGFCHGCSKEFSIHFSKYLFSQNTSGRMDIAFSDENTFY